MIVERGTGGPTDETTLVVALRWGLEGPGKTVAEEVEHPRETDDGLGPDVTHDPTRLSPPTVPFRDYGRPLPV